MDRLVNGIAEDGTIRIIAAVTTDSVGEIVRQHDASPTVGAALGRLLTGSALMAATLKDFDRFTLKIDCSGPVQGLTAEARPDGSIRGYAKVPQADVPPRDDAKFDVAALVGSGMLYSIRESGFDLGLHREPYVGSVPLVSGEIGEDIAYYLAHSEQIPSAVLLGVLLQPVEPYVKASGGVLIQMMPGANEHIITMIEDTIRHAPHVTRSIDEGMGPEDLIKQVLGIIDFEILGEREIRFQCECSYERAVAMITALGKDEVESMIADDGQAVMTCGFCSKEYHVDESELTQVAGKL